MGSKRKANNLGLFNEYFPASTGTVSQPPPPSSSSPPPPPSPSGGRHGAGVRAPVGRARGAEARVRLRHRLPGPSRGGRTRSSSTVLLSPSPSPKPEPKRSRPSKRPRPPDPYDPAAIPPDPSPPPPLLALFATPPGKTEPQQLQEEQEEFFIPPGHALHARRRQIPSPSPSHHPLHQAQAQAQAQAQTEARGGQHPARAPPRRSRFTRSLLAKVKPPVEEQDESGTTTASGGSPSPSPKRGAGGKKEPGRLEAIPTNLKELLATGLLDGHRVKYIMKKGKGAVLWGVIKRSGILCSCASCKGRNGAVLRGVIKRSGILCSCASCKGRNVVSPYYFEVHAGSLKKRPSDYIFLESGNINLYGILKACGDATLDTLEAAIRAAIGPTPQKRRVRCKSCKSQFRTLRTGKFALLCGPCVQSKRARNTPRSQKHGRPLTSAARMPKSFSSGAKTITSPGKITRKYVVLISLELTFIS